MLEPFIHHMLTVYDNIRPKTVDKKPRAEQ